MTALNAPNRFAATAREPAVTGSGITMRIICPGCASHYEVDADKIGADGQLVRCAHCRDVWLARPVGPDVAPKLSVWLDEDFASRAFEAAAPVDFARAKARLRPRFPLDGAAAGGALGVLAIVGVLLGCGMAAVGERTAILHHLPAAGALYDAVGLPAAPDGLALRDVHSSLVAEDGKTVLMLEGSISNLGRDAAPVPPLSAVVRDRARAPLYTWTAPAPKTSLAGGETVAFQSRLAAPPAEGRDVRVSFADASGS